MNEKVKMAFGWKANRNADGFEQPHGRFTMEVFWDNHKRVWNWAVWIMRRVNNKKEPFILERGSTPFLDTSKSAALDTAVTLEREAVKEDNKYR